MARVLVVGGDGLIGRALADVLGASGHPVMSTTRRDRTPPAGRFYLDLSSDTSSWVPPRAVDVTYLCAGATTLDACRDSPAATRAINVTNAVHVARAVTRAGSRVVFLSTSGVFDGSVPRQRADAQTCPVTEYGRQKAEAESGVTEFGELATIVRLTKVWAPRTPRLMDWSRSLRAGQPVQPFADLVVAPLPVAFVAHALARLATRPAPGILQLSGQEDVSYAEIARHLARRCGAVDSLVRPMSASESGVEMEALPRHTTLDDSRVRQEFDLMAPDVWSTVDAAASLE